MDYSVAGQLSCSCTVTDRINKTHDAKQSEGLSMAAGFKCMLNNTYGKD